MSKAAIWIITIIQYIYAADMLILGRVTMTSSITPIHNAIAYLSQIDNILTPLIYLLSAILATIGLVGKFRRMWVFFTLQLSMLYYGMASSLYNIYRGMYSDGYTPDITDHLYSQLFILNDQLRPIGFVVIYTIAILYIYGNRNDK